MSASTVIMVRTSTSHHIANDINLHMQLWNMVNRNIVISALHGHYGAQKLQQ